MTNRMIENCVKKLQVLEQQKKQIEAEIEKIKSELKADLESKGVQVYKTDKGAVVRWQAISSERFDRKRLQEEDPMTYSAYLKSSTVRRFSYVNAT